MVYGLGLVGEHHRAKSFVIAKGSVWGGQDSEPYHISIPIQRILASLIFGSGRPDTGLESVANIGWPRRRAKSR